MKRRFLFILVILTLVLSACGGGNEKAIVRIGWAGSPDNLNPGMGILTESYTIYNLVYDTMYSLNLDGSFTLSIADSVERSDDGLVYTYKIKDGIKWHDGKPLTAEDVAFSYNLYKDTPEYPYLNGYYTTYFASVESKGNEVILTLTEAIPNIESQLVFLYILPKHVWEGVNKLEYENFEMIGSGPFKMAEYAQNEFVRLTANKEHFSRPPKVDEVVFQTFENQDALVQGLKTGQLDMITEMPNTSVETLKAEENVEVVIGAPFSPGVTDIIFNQIDPDNCPTDAGGLCTGHPALRDRNVRLAMAHATDKQKLIDLILLGLGTPGLTLIPDGLGVWYNNSIKDYEYDVAAANKILDDAGYKDTDGDKIREMPDGSKPLTFRLNWPSDSINAPRMAELLSEMWGEIGISLEMQAVDPDALTAQCCPAFDFDIMIWGWGSDPDPSALLYVYTSEGIPTGSSETGYSNPKYDELYAQQQTELNFEARKSIVWEMQKLVHDDVVYIIPFYDAETQAYRSDRFTGWITNQPKVELSDVTSLVLIEPVK
ncbi:MAG TPA: ABC transporter substrate-binding protein [Anaerolineales bacterium]|nr:ABC transporter substrate-binding protein [Anaerolineales bacterium]HMV96437.1 ABC transporter substrate-binding protein [Anaerolineales bacterium]HMX18403.1 ABC transporter substrate-binding protein [Anaerolineales bacterium]HMX73157.1 ABC transporter substrate-binding protein [Anaerolineales bacterium]HMZ41560.1 ABC transporter substrate-binding protein [Anaerolineales bacterium]